MTAETHEQISVEVTFRWTRHEEPEDGGLPRDETSEVKAHFDSIEQARAFRQELDAAIVRADRSDGELADPNDDGRWFETTDAQQWTRRFLQRFAGEGVGHDVVDEGLLIGWFANAIEAGRSAGAAAMIGEDESLDPEQLADEARRWTRAHHGRQHFLVGLDLMAAYSAGARRDHRGVTEDVPF